MHFDIGEGNAGQLDLFKPRYNIAPTQEGLAVRISPDTKERELVPLRWGLIPTWSKEPASGPPLINARSETLAKKPSFRTAYRHRRCLIPADGFYEWQKLAGGKKQPFYIHRPDNGLFAFAGLWERWERGPTIESCTIITTDANDALRPLHDRMPVILAPTDYGLWLDPDVDDPAALEHLLSPVDLSSNDELVAEPVSTHVNRASNDDVKCVEALPQ